MFDLSSLLISSAIAQETSASPLAGQAGLMNYLPFILIFAVFYFLVIRPQQKQLVAQNKMIQALQRGDRIVMSGGIHGKITRLDDTILTIEIANGVEIRVDRSSVQALEVPPSTAPAVESDKK